MTFFSRLVTATVTRSALTVWQVVLIGDSGVGKSCVSMA